MEHRTFPNNSGLITLQGLGPLPASEQLRAIHEKRAREFLDEVNALLSRKYFETIAFWVLDLVGVVVKSVCF
jgi:hypothetical protein